MTKELISHLYSSDEEVKRAAVYRVLFDRRCDLLPELKKAISFEKNEQVAVFMMQVVLTIEAYPRDASMERRILESLQKEGGASELQPSMWKYLCGYGTSAMLIAALGAMGEAIPPDALEFIDACINHPDPEVRSMACEKAIKSGRPTHFAYVLNLITDPDPMVAETAFSVIHSMPVNEMAIVLDYALGSPDEWVLENVAPFLPNLINNGLRQVISKVQYHKHPLVARKAREALKALDAIPYVSKKAKEEADAEKAAGQQKIADAKPDGAEAAQPGEKSLSFKEQMEQKRLQKIEEEKRRKEEDEALARDLATVKPEEMAEFAGQMAVFDATGTGSSAPASDDDGLPGGEVVFVDNRNFETETAVLDAIDENAPILEPPPRPDASKIDLTAAIEEPKPVIVNISDGEIDLAASDKIENEAASVPAAAVSAKRTEQNIAPPVAPQVVDPAKIAHAAASQPPVGASVAAGQRAPVAVPPAAASVKETIKPQPAAQQVTSPGAAVPGPAREIITRYPSFLADPFAMLFQPAKPEVQLKIINQVADNLTAFLNLCFLQSCMYYAAESEALARSIRECLKGYLVGPTALRCLHNFAFAMKAARGSPVFFTFSLSGILSDSSDTNPLMLLRELKEFLRAPEPPFDESLPQAIEGLTEILRGVKSILNNLLVMKAPPGAKEPFADLSGPEAKILPPDKRPGLDLPVGEVVLLSRDGSEAFGLYPFFKYVRKKVVFGRPDEREMSILYERLEIQPA